MTRPASISEHRSLPAAPARQLLRHSSQAPESTPPPASEIILARLALLAELETSLLASHRALLAREISSLEKHTAEQMRLHRALAVLPAPRSHSSANSSVSCRPALAAELRAAEQRVLQLGRVQAALLVRAQRWLRTVAHLLAGVGKTYAPPCGMAGTTAQPAPPGGQNLIHPAAGEKQERDSCRA